MKNNKSIEAQRNAIRNQGTQSDVALMVSEEQILNAYRKAVKGSCGKEATEVFSHVSVHGIK